MHIVCIACNERFMYVDGDEDCTEFVCSHCMGSDRKMKPGHWERLRFRILNRDEFKCRYCGRSPMNDNSCVLHIDHIIPISKFGTNSEKNLITACDLCNYGKLCSIIKAESKHVLDKYIKSKEEKLRDGNLKEVKRKRR